MTEPDHQEGAHESSIRLPRELDCAARARAHVERELAPRAGDDTVVSALLVVSELVTNAYQHGEGEIDLKLRADGERVRIEVVDEGTQNVPEIRQVTEDGEGGWGLQVVETVAERWGVFEGTTHVWADVPLHPR